MRKISYIGLDMDHTLVRYNSQAFEKLAHETMCRKLVEQHGYPASVLDLNFDYDLSIRGLVIDRKLGNLLKVSRYGGIRASFHGTAPIDFLTQKHIYRSTYIDLFDSSCYWVVDTTFSIALATLFMQLVDLKDHSQQDKLPEYDDIAAILRKILDEIHNDGTLKDKVARYLDQYIIKDPKLVEGLERYLKHGKKIFILTNSDFNYTNILLNYAINPFLKEHSSWKDLFEIVITDAQKPRFFYEKNKFLKINPEDGTMSHLETRLGPGIYQGGCADQFTTDLELDGGEILYIGDHIYSDVVKVKKSCNWRTALVIEELESEIRNFKLTQPDMIEISKLMEKKEPFENRLTELISTKIETNASVDEKMVGLLQNQITDIDKQISTLIVKQQSVFNRYWGEVMHAGNEESYFSYQMERFACIYMAKLQDLMELSPRTYFRAVRKPLVHEMVQD